MPKENVSLCGYCDYAACYCNSKKHKRKRKERRCAVYRKEVKSKYFKSKRKRLKIKEGKE